MAVKKRFSKDPKVNLLSIEKFLENNGYLCGITEEYLWKANTAPKHSEIYYKFTPNFLICTIYGGYHDFYSSINFGLNIKEKLELIEVAYRDGKTEFELFDNKINELKEKISNRRKSKKNKKLNKQIAELKKARKLLPSYSEKTEPIAKTFESYLSDTGYKTSNESLKNKYLVFDVETNGIRTSNDDLLSLSIYDPTTGICYNRYFPLDLQPLVLTGFIHNIDDEMLVNASHMTQQELDWLNDYFHLKDRILLSYSGGKGTFDSSFVKNYCKRHGIFGFDNLNFENIKSKIPPAPYGTGGQLTKDNLCTMFGIEGVNKIHSSYNDCILEWKLFEKLETECFFFIDKDLFKYNPKYIIPYSYLFSNPNLVKHANVKVPNVQGKATELFKFKFPKNILKEIKKFETNITGTTIEHGINSYLRAEKQDNFLFLLQNKSHLQYIGSLESSIKEIPIIKEDDGTVKAVKEEDEQYIKEVNDVTKKIIEQIKPVADYLKENIFKENKIMTQELSISDDGKVLALCDLSDSKNVVEIKTKTILEEDKNGYGLIKNDLAKQLYFQSKGRKTYVLSIRFEFHFNERSEKFIFDGLNVYLYKVDLFDYDLLQWL